MALMNVFAKAISKETEITFWQMGVIRGLFMAMGCFIHAKCIGQSLLDIPQGFGWLVFFRAFFGFLSSSGQFASIFLCPLSIAIVLYFT